MGYDWKKAADYHYEQQQAQKDLKHNTISKEAQGKAMQQFNEILEQNRHVELQHHHVSFTVTSKAAQIRAAGQMVVHLFQQGY